MDGIENVLADILTSSLDEGAQDAAMSHAQSSQTILELIRMVFDADSALIVAFRDRGDGVLPLVSMGGTGEGVANDLARAIARQIADVCEKHPQIHMDRAYKYSRERGEE